MNGLSPPTRGILARSQGETFPDRSIPAYAGDPRQEQSVSRAARVYPRLRGGSEPNHNTENKPKGLSPPTRGIPVLWPLCALAARSIPAYAGDPIPSPAEPQPRGVYPRLRGGSARWRPIPPARQGLSPPTRGIPRYPARFVGVLGSIPAYAGDPPTTCYRIAALKVYPRLRGGSVDVRPCGIADTGLSPPTRGIRNKGGGRDA